MKINYWDTPNQRRQRGSGMTSDLIAWIMGGETENQRAINKALLPKEDQNEVANRALGDEKYENLSSEDDIYEK